MNGLLFVYCIMFFQGVRVKCVNGGMQKKSTDCSDRIYHKTPPIVILITVYY